MCECALNESTPIKHHTNSRVFAPQRCSAPVHCVKIYGWLFVCTAYVLPQPCFRRSLCGVYKIMPQLIFHSPPRSKRARAHPAKTRRAHHIYTYIYTNVCYTKRQLHLFSATTNNHVSHATPQANLDKTALRALSGIWNINGKYEESISIDCCQTFQ